MMSLDQWTSWGYRAAHRASHRGSWSREKKGQERQRSRQGACKGWLRCFLWCTFPHPPCSRANLDSSTPPLCHGTPLEEIMKFWLKRYICQKPELLLLWLRQTKTLVVNSYWLILHFPRTTCFVDTDVSVTDIHIGAAIASNSRLRYYQEYSWQGCVYCLQIEQLVGKRSRPWKGARKEPTQKPKIWWSQKIQRSQGQCQRWKGLMS